MLRHAETMLELSIPTRNWALSEAGMASARAVAESGVFDNVSSIYSSTECKAIETARPIAERLNLDINTDSRLDELNRGTGSTDSFTNYHSLVEQILSFPPILVVGWEDPSLALKRFQSAIEDISKKESRRALVVSHGIVITLFFSHLLSIRASAFHRWFQLRFLDWGEISQGYVTKDIV
ncbi:MAG: histidine phosphatase family protein [Candidatus Thorarchaeota archaeon]